MSGKYVSITAGVLLVVGCLIGVSVIIFQEDTSETSVGPLERSFRTDWNKQIEGINGFSSLPSVNSGGKPLQFPPSTIGKAETFPRKNPTPKREVVSSTMRMLPEISVIPLSVPSTLSPVVLSSSPPPSQKDFRYHWPVSNNKEIEIPDWEDTRDLLRNSTKEIRYSTLPDPKGDTEAISWEEESPPDVPSYEDSYVDDEDEVPDGGGLDASDWESSELNELLQIASRLYTSELNVTDFQGFVRIVNETINRRSESGFLNQLNQLYSRPSTPSNPGSVSIGRNAYESSLTAFAFMSFGVFLLNQIHNLIGKATTETVQGRQLRNAAEESHLQILFNSPSSSSSLENHREIGSMEDKSNGRTRSNTNTDGGLVANNMFRAMLNLVNAYTKDSQALECIWSIYCEDLDKTSGIEGLYGLAARINSIGLRLIMHQISAELTFDVMLRSLLGWDGLPCKKMFPKCQPEDASLTLRAATTSVPGSQFKGPNVTENKQ